MRTLALAAFVGLGMTVGGVALAGPWSDPAGRVNFEAPRGWQVQPAQSATSTQVLIFDASHDCVVVGVNNPGTAAATASGVNRAMRNPSAPATWLAAANSISDLFPGGSAQITSQTVDTSGFWPVQRAELTSPRGTVYGVIQARPGAEMFAFCSALGDASTSVFETIFASISHPNDATWRAAIEQEAAAQAPAN
jgi:hypothetical protein